MREWVLAFVILTHGIPPYKNISVGLRRSLQFGDCNFANVHPVLMRSNGTIPKHHYNSAARTIIIRSPLWTHTTIPTYDPVVSGFWHNHGAQSSAQADRTFLYPDFFTTVSLLVHQCGVSQIAIVKGTQQPVTRHRHIRDVVILYS